MKRTLAILGLIVLTGFIAAGCEEGCCGTCGGKAKATTCAKKADGATCAAKGEKACAAKAAVGEAKTCCGGKEAACPSKAVCKACNKPKAECACPKK